MSLGIMPSLLSHTPLTQVVTDGINPLTTVVKVRVKAIFMS